ncbi:MAG: hypothetical protein FWG87_08545 [Defluviitaleaceae bacterium]|nr:hypothetical protein [Defluviitaleaceae bacterium]
MFLRITNLKGCCKPCNSPSRLVTKFPPQHSGEKGLRPQGPATTFPPTYPHKKHIEALS